MLVAIGLFFFILLIVIHEYGHFLVAKRNGVDVEEFGIGFPPKIVGKTIGKGIFRAYYSINLLPIGGFVRLKGETDADKRKGSLGTASLWVKTKIMLAGVFMNWVAAAVILTILAWTGMPKLIDNQFTVNSDTEIVSSQVLIGFVEEDSPASRAGLEFGDTLVKLGGVEVTDSDKLFDLTQGNAGKSVDLEYIRDNTTYNEATTLNADNQTQGYLGVSPADFSSQRSTWSAPLVGIGLTAQLSWETLQGLGGLVADVFSGNASEAGDQVAGPVGIYQLLEDVSEIGVSYVFFLIAIISLTLAVMNALPIPALDGGRLFVTLLYRVIRKPLTPKAEQIIHGTGMVALLALILLVTVLDIQRL